MPEPPDDPLLTIPAVAERLGMSSSTVKRLIRETLIWGTETPDGMQAVRESELQRFLGRFGSSLPIAKRKHSPDCRRSRFVHANCDKCGERPEVIHRPRNEKGTGYCEDCCPVCKGVKPDVLRP